MIKIRYFIASGIPQIEEINWSDQVDNFILSASNIIAATADNGGALYYTRPAAVEATKISDSLLHGTPPPTWWTTAKVAHDAAMETAREQARLYPKEVTMRQARLALLAIDRLGDVETAIASMPGKEWAAAKIEWEYSSNLKRTQPLVAQIGEVLGLSSSDLDELFRTASQL
jgi:hypothetical protein